MNELTDKEIKDYLGNLPKGVLFAVQDKTWSKKVEEISTKYSLNDVQSTTLKNLVLFVIIGVEEGETFADSVEKELGISNLLAEQIIKDIDERVFQYIFNLISESPKENNQKIENVDENLPEVRPEITPMVEKGEGVQIKTVPPVRLVETPQNEQKNSFWQTKEKTAPDNLPGTEMKEEEQKIFIGSEFIQKPVAVVDYSTTPLDQSTKEDAQQAPSSSETQKPQNIIDEKLNSQVIKPANSNIQTPPTKYTADPYREPIE